MRPEGSIFLLSGENGTKKCYDPYLDYGIIDEHEHALLKKGRQIKLEQRPRAEADTAVAAASIIARANFVQVMEQLSIRLGRTLPKGAYDPSIITVGREIVAKGGRDALSEVAKLHFKTTEKILQGI